MKLAIVDLDGVVADNTLRFEKAEEAKQAFMQDKDARMEAILSGKKTATDAFRQTAFTPDLVALDTLIKGANEDILRLEYEGYHIVFMTSRPVSMEKATRQWLTTHIVSSQLHALVMKPTAFQFTKTIIWKAGMIQHLVAWFDSGDVLVVDDEDANLAEIQTHNGTYRLCKSLTEAVAEVVAEANPIVDTELDEHPF